MFFWRVIWPLNVPKILYESLHVGYFNDDVRSLGIKSHPLISYGNDEKNV